VNKVGKKRSAYLKAYYQDESVTIYLADNRDIKDPGPVDVIITDPPYTSGDIGKRHIDSGFEKPADDWITPMFQLSQTIAVSPGIANIWQYPPARWVLCWYKPGAPSFNKLGGYNAWEPILVYGKPRGKFGQDTFEQVPLNFKRGLEKEHPCAKPVNLWAWLLTGMTKPGDTIFDPYLGSGTTAVCAKRLGRKCIGIEIKEQYCEISAKRVQQTVYEGIKIKAGVKAQQMKMVENK
jgi:DNA modification methylase